MDDFFNKATFVTLVILTLCLAMGALLHLFAGNYLWSGIQAVLCYVAYRATNVVHKERKEQRA